MAATYPYNEKKLKLINALIASISDNDIALYSGNGVSAELYLTLSLSNRNKISYVIDNSPACKCSRFDVSVISLDKVVEAGIRNILIATRAFPSELKRILINCKERVHVFGLYGWFEVNGYHTKHNFYDFVIQSMDAPLPSPASIPDFLHFAAPNALCEVLVALVVQNEKTLLARLHDLLKQVPLGIRIHHINSKTNCKLCRFSIWRYDR